MKLKKMSTLIACGALVAAIGAVSVSASSPFTTLQVKVEDGVKHYSTDDGKTWSTEAPEGVTETTDENGKVTITRGNAPADGEAEGQKFYTSQHGVDEGAQEGIIDGEAGQAGLMIKVEDGVKLYSTDGGKTWSQDAPQGYSEHDGVSTYSFGNPSDEGGKYLTRMEDGVKRHSADGGKTWSEQPAR
jgi:photosystem II stability/assembly factor-like uncharacterized protein